MSSIFTTLLVQPMLNALVWFYDVIPGRDIGISIILLTLLIKLVLYPFTLAQIKQQKALQSLQPKIDEIRARLKDNREEQAKELMALYGKEKVNPAASCLPLIIQIPVIWALFNALKYGLASQSLNLLYPFVPNPQQISPLMFGLIDLSQPSYFLAIAAALVQFLQTKQILKPPAATVMTPPPDVVKAEGAQDESMATMMNKQMTYMLPVITAIAGFSLPGGITLYWLVMSVFTVIQQAFVLKKMPPKIEPQL